MGGEVDGDRDSPSPAPCVVALVAPQLGDAAGAGSPPACAEGAATAAAEEEVAEEVADEAAEEAGEEVGVLAHTSSGYCSCAPPAMARAIPRYARCTDRLPCSSSISLARA